MSLLIALAILFFVLFVVYRFLLYFTIRALIYLDLLPRGWIDEMSITAPVMPPRQDDPVVQEPGYAEAGVTVRAWDRVERYVILHPNRFWLTVVVVASSVVFAAVSHK